MNLHERLKEERERLGYSQTAFAALADASKHSQINWEKGTASPNALVLSAWASAGLDVLYVVTGQRAGGTAAAPPLTAKETTVLDLFRSASPDVQNAVIGALVGVRAAPVPPEVSMTNHGMGGVQIGVHLGGKVQARTKRR